MSDDSDLPWPFEGFEEDLSFGGLSSETASLVVPAAGLPEDESSRRFVVYLGLFDLLAEALVNSSVSDQEAAAGLREVLLRVEAVEGPLRFALHEEREGAERHDLVARMREKEIAVTREWMVPKLEAEIRLYRERIAALRESLSRTHQGTEPS